NTLLFIYNVYFHPLSNVPGPKHLILSSIVKVYYQFRGTLQLNINRWHNLYGPVIRLGVNEISVIDQYYSTEIYCNQNYKKSKLMELLGVMFGKNLFTIRDRVEHINRKKMVCEAFNRRSLIRMEAVIWEDGVKELLNKLENNTEEGQIVNLASEFHNLTFDVIGKLIFGQHFNLLANHSHQLIDNFNNFNIMLIMLTTFPFLRYIRVPFLSKFYNAIDYKNDFAKKAVKLKKLSNSREEDIMDHYLEARDPETDTKLTDKELQDETMILLFSGVDTTASTISMCIYHLLKYPNVYFNVLEELDRVKPVDEVTGKIRSFSWLKENIPYLGAVIYETIRLYPAFAFGVPRLVPEGGATAAGYYLPSDTEVSVSIFSYQRSAQYFENPDEFIPSRWLRNSKDELKHSIIAFGRGSTTCIGKQLALIQITLTLVGLLTRFEL
ncbi:cytochrome P450, partial [Conidiobolus coronatus NRRL 28638]